MEDVEKMINMIGKIDGKNLPSELSEHSSRYAWFSVLYEKAKSKEERAKWDLKIIEAELDKEYRSKGDKVTERYLEKAIIMDPRYRNKLEEYLKLREEVLKHKKDMLVSYVSITKEEMKLRMGFFEAEKREEL
jgi:hypothetical protein